MLLQTRRDWRIWRKFLCFLIPFFLPAVFPGDGDGDGDGDDEESVLRERESLTTPESAAVEVLGENGWELYGNSGVKVNNNGGGRRTWKSSGVGDE